MNKFMQLNFLGIAFFTVIISHANEHNVNKSFNSTAKIENICNLEVQDINFGVISLPLTTQSANSEMNILCTNNTAYEIKIKYNNKSGDVPGLKITRAGDGVPQGNGPEYNVYIDEKKVGIMACGWSYKNYYKGKVIFSSKAVADLFGSTVYGSASQGKWHTDTYGACTLETIPGPNYKSLVNAISNGAMLGLNKGDKLAYQILLPGTNDTWGTGNDTFKSIGTGSQVSITLNARIMPENSSSLYVAQDTYIENVVTEIIF